MNKDKLRVAIAVACGWRWREIGDTIEWIAPKRYSPPDYPNDLNAMHEAEMTLTPSQRCDFVRHLNDSHIVGDGNILTSSPNCNVRFYEAFPAIHATALQRAEAFARVMGIWEDDK